MHIIWIVHRIQLHLKATEWHCLSILLDKQSLFPKEKCIVHSTIIKPLITDLYKQNDWWRHTKRKFLPLLGIYQQNSWLLASQCLTTGTDPSCYFPASSPHIERMESGYWKLQLQWGCKPSSSTSPCSIAPLVKARVNFSAPPPSINMRREIRNVLATTSFLQVWYISLVFWTHFQLSNLHYILLLLLYHWIPVSTRFWSQNFEIQ